jgi:hypothetical protein
VFIKTEERMTEERDRNLTVAGHEISGAGADFDKIHARLSALRPGSTLIVKVLRGGKVVELSAEVEKK